MAKEILLYNYIVDETVQDIIERMEENMNEEIILRINSGGGSVFSGWGVPAKMQEHGSVNIKVDGLAASMAAQWCLYANDVECLDVSRFLLHRADAPVTNEEQQKLLDGVNKDLRSKMKMKLNADKFKEIAGMTIDQMFDAEEQVNVWLTAKQAKSIGLVNKVTKLNPTQVKAMNEFIYKVAAQAEPEKKIETQIHTIMTLAELKAQHPGIYNEAVAIGRAEGKAEEKDRVDACLVFMDIDSKGVKAAIESGKPLSAKQTAEFMLKSTSADSLKALAAAAAPAVTTVAVSPTAATEKEKKEEEFMQEVYASIGLGKKQAVVKTVVAE